MFLKLTDYEGVPFVINLDTVEVIRQKSDDKDVVEIHCVSGGIYKIEVLNLEELLKQVFNDDSKQ